MKKFEILKSIKSEKNIALNMILTLGMKNLIVFNLNIVSNIKILITSNKSGRLIKEFSEILIESLKCLCSNKELKDQIG